MNKKITEIQKLLEKEFNTKVSVKYQSSSLFSLYSVQFDEPFQIKNKMFSQLAIKEIDLKNSNQSREMAQTELESLQNLFNYNARVPFPITVIKNQNAYLVMEYVNKTSISGEGKRDLIRSLKNLYSHRNLKYGYNKNNFIGTLIQVNQEYDNFFDFWWHSRLEVMMDLAIKKGYFDQKDKEKLLNITKHLCEKWNFDKDQPRPVHGDLWSGNILFSSQTAYLIDPSFGFSHPVQDFAMLELFGSPLSFSDYIEVANYCNFSIHPEMIEFFQIYPLLVHVILFGISYKYSIMNFINRYPL